MVFLAVKFLVNDVIYNIRTCCIISGLAIFSSTDTLVKMPVFMSDISLGLAEVPITFMFLTLCGFCTSIMWGSIFNLAVEGLGKQQKLHLVSL